jgi:oligopeptide transport system substrate-binding protein
LRYRAGDLDMTAAVPATRVVELLAQRSPDLRMGPFLGTYFLGFNLQRPPFAANPDLRLALSLAIDREALAQQVLKGTQAPAYGLVPPGTAGYQPQAHAWSSIAMEERVAQARVLYARATGPSARPLKIRVIYGNSQLVRTTLIAVAAMWKEAFGLEVDIVSEEFRSFLDTQRDPNRWEVLRMGWIADYNDASNFLEMFRTDSANNLYGYANPAFDLLLDQAQRTLEPVARAELLEEAERTLLADQAFIPVFYFLSKRLVSPRVVGLQMTPLNRVYSRHLRLTD